MKYFITILFMFFSINSYADEDGYVGSKGVGADFFNNTKIDDKKLAGVGIMKSCDYLVSQAISSTQLTKHAIGGLFDKDMDEFLRSPNGKITAGTRKIVAVEGDTIYIHGSNMSGNKEWALKLVGTPQTKWISNKMIKSGDWVNYLGKYIENTSVSFGSGNNQRMLETKVIQLTCVNKL